MGGIYKLNADDTWAPLMDWVGNANWGDWGPESLALDPTDAKKLYVATGEVTCLKLCRILIALGMYTNWWDPNTGSIHKSVDGGSTWTQSKLPFKVHNDIISSASAC